MSHVLRNWITRWSLWCYRHGKLVLTLLLAASLAAAVLASQRFSLNSDVGGLIKPSPENRWHAQHEAFSEAFPDEGDSALVVVSGTDPDAVLETTDSLLERFGQSDWYHSVRAPGRDAFITERGLYFLELDELAERVSDGLDLLPLLEELAEQPNLEGMINLIGLSGDERLLQVLARALAGAEKPWREPAPDSLQQSYQFIILKARQQFGASAPSQAVMEATREITGRVSLETPGVDIRITGEIAMADEELRTALDGIQFAGMLSLILLAFILGFGVRSLSIVMATFILLGAGVAWTTLYATLAVGSFNTLSLVFLVMFFGLGVDFALHYCLRVEEAESNPDESSAPIRFATDDIGTALLLCTVTSGMAFLSFYPTEYRGLAELGVISAGGMLIAFALTLSLLPAWFAVFGMPQPWRPGDTRRMHFGVDQLPPRRVLILAVLVALGAAWLAREARFDYSVLAMRDKDTEAISTLLELQREGLVTDYSISVLAEPGNISSLRERLEALDSVATTQGPEILVPRGQAAKQELLQGLAPLTAFPLPDLMPTETRAEVNATLAVAAELALGLEGMDDWQALAGQLETLKAQEVPGLELRLVGGFLEEVATLAELARAQPFDLDDLPLASRASLIAPDDRILLKVLPRDTLDSLPAIDRFVSDVESVAPNIAGRTVVERGIGQAVVSSFNTAVVLALAGIFIVLLIYFREPLTPLLVLVPLGLTTLFTFALIAATDLSLNMANILVVPLIFGLGVDTGVHVVHRYHGARDISDVLRSSTPRAVTLSALTTIGTFFSLSFSPHKGAASIGLILSAAIAILMVVTFVVLPALLALFEPLKAREES